MRTSRNSHDQRRRLIRGDDDVLTWSGAVEVEHAPEWSRAWRLPRRSIGLFPGDDLRARAVAPAGVRLAFGTDSDVIDGVAVVHDSDMGSVDLVVDDQLIASALVGPDGRFSFEPVPDGEKSVEVWLPQHGPFRLARLELDGGARAWPVPADTRPKLVTYGSSITQCAHAASPARTWPALVARHLGMDLTCLGFGGQCHLDPMIARMIRDRPADLITTCVGINIYGRGTFNQRSFLPSVLGFLSTIRDGHPGVPILVISPIYAPNREDVVGDTGMTLAQMRAEVGEAVSLLGEHGDSDVHLLDGLTVLGSDNGHMLADRLHPDAEGYQHMADAVTSVVEALLSGAALDMRGRTNTNTPGGNT